MTGVVTWFDSTRGHPTLFRGGFDMRFRVEIVEYEVSGGWGAVLEKKSGGRWCPVTNCYANKRTDALERLRVRVVSAVVGSVYNDCMRAIEAAARSDWERDHDDALHSAVDKAIQVPVSGDEPSRVVRSFTT